MSPAPSGPSMGPSTSASTGDWDGLVVLSGSVSWDGSRLGSNFLAEALARHVPVLYVDPPVPAHRGRPRLEMVADRLARLTPVAPPGKDRPGVLPVTNALFRLALRVAVARLGGRVRAVISGPVKYDPFGITGETVRIFRASDDFAAGADLTGLPAGTLAAREQRLAARAGTVVCVSPVLVDKWRRLGHDPVLIPNGCDAAFLARVREPGIRPADDVDLPRPVAGYLGQLSSRIDLDLLRAVADAGHSLLLVGKRRSDLPAAVLAELAARPNVCWVGDRPFEDLLPYLAAMDVGLVPYGTSAFNRASFPLKTLEYVGAGLPVVATDLPAVRWLGPDHVHVATSPAAFAAAVGTAAATASDPQLVAARLRFAASHSWDARAAAYLELLDRPT